MENELIYVYCVANAPPDLGSGELLKGLRSIQQGELYVIVKDVPENEFSEENFKRNLSNVLWLETNARQHVDTINLLMEHVPVIPFKFGTLFHTEASLAKFIDQYTDALNENFKHIANKEEWAVKVFCDRQALSQEIDELSEEAADLETQIMASGPGKAFLLRRKKTELIENEMDRLCVKFGQEYYDELYTLSSAVLLNNLLPKEFTGRQDSMILNTTFLVNKERVKEFRSKVESMKEMNKKCGFIIEVNGPWPPFSFISIKEKH